MIDPQQAYLLTSEIRNLVPSVSGSDLHTLQGDFATHLHSQQSRREPFSTWQEAWNDFVGPRRQITYTPTRCPNCHGRGFSHRGASRNLARTGNPMICGECMGGTRRGRSRITVNASHATIPTKPDLA